MSLTQPNDLPGAIAIIGLAGRFPHARNLEEFWQNLKDGREVVSFFTEEELTSAGIDPEFFQHPNYVPARAILEDPELFDASFFGYSPREAEIIDPQQRLFLECAWEALENAGCDTDRYDGIIGVYGGLSMNSYLYANILANPNTMRAAGAYQIMLGNDKDFLATRTSYKLNLKGPSVDVQTACSTSLVAVQMACQSLLNYQCDVALAGGVSVQMPRKAGYLYQPGMIMSPDGHCRAFDHQAQGIVAGEGVGMVVLKRYAEAVKDGDTIHAIIRGSAVNNDGALKVGYTAPSVDGQTEVIMMAQAVGGVEPGSITYIEAHGTGTELGDPIEITALTQAFRIGTDEKGFCAIGSVKTNMGHLDAAAGVAGLIKTVLALKHKKLPPSLHYEKPNPGIDFENSPFYVNNRLKDWDTGRLPRRAGISSFGIGGTNAHVVLEEAPDEPAGQSAHAEQLLLLSARTEAALNAASHNLANWLRQNPPDRLADAAYTLQVGRKVFKHRRVVVCSSAGEAIPALETLDPKLAFSAQQDVQNNPVVFLFPGQGAQYVNMGRGLYEHEPLYRQQVNRCAEILDPHLGLDLRCVLYPNTMEEEQRAGELISQTWITQPALFVIEYALAKLWMSWGIRPQAMVGHSIGEYVAACLAGVFSLEDGLALVAARGKLMQSLPGGSMLSVPLTEAELLPLLDGELSLAAINAPKMCVVSGSHPAVERLQASLTARGVACRKLRTSHAFHSPMMEPILAPFTERVGQVALKEPQIPFLSNLSGTWITPAQAASPAYWSAHLRSTVRFAQNVELLFQQPAVMLEVGPGQTLSTLARQHPRKPAGQAILTSVRHPQEAASDTAFITTTLGRLWLSGVSPDWNAYQAGGMNLRRIPLPTYPFERRRYCVEPQKQAVSQDRPSIAKRKDLSTWFYVPSWQRSAWPAGRTQAPEKQNWLVFCDASGVSQAVIAELEQQGQVFNRVLPGDSYARLDERTYQLPPRGEEAYLSLYQDLASRSELPDRILHLWLITGPPDDSLETLDDLQAKGFYCLVDLAKAIGEYSGRKPISLLVVSNGLHEVTGGERLDPVKATVLGTTKVIPDEFPNVTSRSVDVVLPEPVNHPSKELVDQILAEFDVPDNELVVAHRGRHRWVQRYISHPLTETAPGQSRLRVGGVYLITGGYGGIGLSLAGFLAKEVRARLVLVGRSGLPEREKWRAWLSEHGPDDPVSKKIRAVQEIEACGGSVLMLKADASDLSQMRQVVEQAKAHFGPISGVIHAAGALAGGLIQLKTNEEMEEVICPKVQGMWVLGQVVKDELLDFMMLCSSIDSVVTYLALADYTAGNIYLDAYAAQAARNGSDVKVHSINWAAWQEVGMAASSEVPVHLQDWKEDRLAHGIHPTEGFEAFKRVLSIPEPQVVVSPRDVEVVLQVVEAQKALRKAGVVSPGSEPAATGEEIVIEQAGSQARSGIQTPYAPPATETEKRIVTIWEDIIGVKPVGIHDNFFELGGHSLMATQILARIRDTYAVELSLRAFFETTTIAEMGQRIDALVWIANNQGSSSPSDDSTTSSDREELSL